MRLKDKVALVTGGTAGLGAAIVERFASEGAAVAFTGRSQERGDAVAERVRAAGGRALFLPADNAVEADIESAVSRTAEEFGSLGVLVNNAAATEASMSSDSHVDTIETEAWDYIIKTALYGAMWASKYAIPLMRQAGGGSIVNISASSSMLAARSRPAYQSSKGAINSLSRQMAYDYGQDNIRTNAIVVGFIRTENPIMDKLVADEEYLSAIMTSVVLPRLGEPLDIANAALFLACDESKFVTGSLLTVDGGMTCHQNVLPRTITRAQATDGAAS